MGGRVGGLARVDLLGGAIPVLLAVHVDVDVARLLFLGQARGQVERVADEVMVVTGGLAGTGSVATMPRSRIDCSMSRWSPGSKDGSVEP